MPREELIPARTALIEIQRVEHFPGNHVRVHIGTGAFRTVPAGLGIAGTREEFVFDAGQNYMTVIIGGDDYIALTAESPDWAPGKPAGSFRHEDLWRFIDIIRARPGA